MIDKSDRPRFRFFSVGRLARYFLLVTGLCLADSLSASVLDSSNPVSPQTALFDSAKPNPAVLAAPRIRKANRLKVEANQAFRQGHVSEACAKYGQAQALDTSDASIRAALGFCLIKLGKRDSAFQVSREALRLAGLGLESLTDTEWSVKDMIARKSAYFNLDKLGGPMPDPDSGKCETWANLSTCAKAMYVCADVGRQRSRRGVLHWSVLRVGMTPAQANFKPEESQNPGDLPRPELRDMEEQAIDGTYESRVKWLNRDSIATIPMGERLENLDATGGTKCQDADGWLSECRILYFDPCTGVIATACGLVGEGESDRILIGEFYLIPAR